MLANLFETSLVPLNQNNLYFGGQIRKVWLSSYTSKCFQPKMQNFSLGKVITRFLWAC